MLSPDTPSSNDHTATVAAAAAAAAFDRGTCYSTVTRFHITTEQNLMDLLSYLDSHFPRWHPSRVPVARAAGLGYGVT